MKVDKKGLFITATVAAFTTIIAGIGYQKYHDSINPVPKDYQADYEAIENIGIIYADGDAILVNMDDIMISRGDNNTLIIYTNDGDILETSDEGMRIISGIRSHVDAYKFATAEVGIEHVIDLTSSRDLIIEDEERSKLTL